MLDTVCQPYFSLILRAIFNIILAFLCILTLYPCQNGILQVTQLAIPRAKVAKNLHNIILFPVAYSFSEL